MSAGSSLHLLIIHVLVLSIDQIQLLYFRLELSLNLLQVFEVALEIPKRPDLAQLMLFRQMIAVLGSVIVNGAQLIHRHRLLGLTVLYIASHFVALWVIFRQVKAFKLS